jgi:hypothetical protein
MQHLYIVTMWSGGRANKKWKTDEEPMLLTQGTGVRFRDLETRLTVQVIGSVSVEEYEHGLHDLTEEVDLPDPGEGPDES